MTSPRERNVFDAHCHLDAAGSAYDLAVAGRNVIFNDVTSYRRQSTGARDGDSITLILDLDAVDFVRAEVVRGAVAAVKIHSRIQRLRAPDYDRIVEALETFPDRAPIVIDAFYYGKALEHQPSLAQIIRIAETFPARDVVVAHCGGYRLLEYFFHLRELGNAHYDLSFALQYLADTSLLRDLEKLIRFTPPKRVLFGSDYPYASPATQYDILVRICADAGLDDAAVDAVLHGNARRLFFRAAAA